VGPWPFWFSVPLSMKANPGRGHGMPDPPVRLEKFALRDTKNAPTAGASAIDVSNPMACNSVSCLRPGCSNLRLALLHPRA